MLRELNKESILLLYLADELSAEDRAEVERMLQADAGLRTELQQLSGTLKVFESGMARLDARPLAAEAAVSRRIGNAMRNRLAERMTRPAPAPAARPRGSRFPTWAYPVAAAAAVLVVLGGFLYVQSTKNLPPDRRVIVPPMPGNPILPTTAPAAPESALASGDADEAEPHTDLQWYRGSQHQLAELSRSGNPGTDAIFGLNDSNE